MGEDFVPETFRGALESGKLGAWLKEQIVYGAVGLVLLGALGVGLYFFAPVGQVSDTGAGRAANVDIADIPHQAQVLWDKGDQAGAIALFLKVADKTPEAEAMMGTLYEVASAPNQSDMKSTQWFKQAAEHGFAPAERQLAISYQTGRGLAVDPFEAYRWSRLASQRAGTDTALKTASDTLAAQMAVNLTPEKIAAADEWVKAWQPKAQ